MPKDDILRCIEEIDSKLAELDRAVEQLPDTMQASQAGPWSEPGRENTLTSDLRLLHAAQGEGITTFNPEAALQVQLDALLSGT